jgi:predicted SprT family Zn-dependent metalloprotease
MNSYMKKLSLWGIVVMSSVIFAFNDYKTYNKKDSEFQKFINDVKKLEKTYMMTRNLADLIIEAHN